MDGLIAGPLVGADSFGIPTVLDPSLEVMGTPVSGVMTPTVIRVYADLGSSVDLLLGTKPQILDPGDGGVIELLVVVDQVINLGGVGLGGFVEIPLPLGNQPRGTTFIVQAAVQGPAPAGPERTNSATLVVR